ncbi:hypothetical protein Y1Q_0022060 [Alligator mississippiensis]|uniref:Uncharacterized protein n=1 Tax=Alligator mississippiensis TaxID=8496 RepID=A0A151NLU1_ALLMI|nr:hypothetical protein Y1Q_0022060 [Alligator mississippiensis]
MIKVSSKHGRQVKRETQDTEMETERSPGGEPTTSDSQLLQTLIFNIAESIWISFMLVWEFIKTVSGREDEDNQGIDLVITALHGNGTFASVEDDIQDAAEVVYLLLPVLEGMFGKRHTI